jgi:hypothetical protein
LTGGLSCGGDFCEASVDAFVAFSSVAGDCGSGTGCVSKVSENAFSEVAGDRNWRGGPGEDGGSARFCPGLSVWRKETVTAIASATTPEVIRIIRFAFITSGAETTTFWNSD